MRRSRSLSRFDRSRPSAMQLYKNYFLAFQVATKFTPVVADLMKLDEAVKAVEATGEHIDLLVNNAGLVILKETIDVTEEDIDRYVIRMVKFLANVFSWKCLFVSIKLI